MIILQIPRVSAIYYSFAVSVRYCDNPSFFAARLDLVWNQ